MEARILKRSDRVREYFSKYNIENFLITKSEDVSYLTGLAGEDCAVLITSDKKYILTDSRYETAMSVLTPEFELIIEFDYIDYIKKVKPEKMGIQGEIMTVDMYNELASAIPTEDLIPLTGIMQDLRLIKEDEELEILAEAEAIGDAAFADILGFIEPGMTEKRIATEIEYFMKLHGADGLSFSTISVSGINSSKPHGIPSEKVVKNGELLTLDFGCKYKGYCSDMTRTLAIGKISDEMRNLYEVVLEAQMNACEKLKPGMHVKDGDALARDIIKKYGFGEYFGHGLGHGVGLEIHEDPYLSFRGNHILKENMTVTIEPGIYLPNKFGVRIEDLVFITADGIKNVTGSPKELITI
ncbi:MAG: aminopeptidase P family protein [Eubacteriales bacterium]